jgi:type I restriction enzyme S subunit
LQRYRQSVLKAACEGRLVPTEAELARAEERPFEDGATLLQRVLAERRRQWEADNRPQQPKDDKWKDKYRQPAAPDLSSLPELPDGWSWATVEQLGHIQLGRQRSPKNHQGPHMRSYLRAANATWNGVDLSDVMEMNFAPEEFERYRLHNGDILLSEASGSAAEVGKPFIWKNQLPDCAFQNTLIRVQVPAEITEYLYLHFLTDAQTGRFGQIAKGVGIYHLGAIRLASMAIALPPLAEQERIVEEVERRLSVIEQHKQVIAASLKRAERLRQSILKRAFAGQLVAQDPNDEPASVLLAGKIENQSEITPAE